MAQDEIVLISDPRVLQIQIQENNDPLIDMRTIPELIIDTRKSNSSNSYFKLRQSVLMKLVEASSSLPDGIRFLIVEGYRPLSLQTEYFKKHSEKLRNLYPDWTSDQIYQEASKYVAPPETIPPHSTGGAVDLTLVDSLGEELDLGTTMNVDPEESECACFTSAQNISETTKINRQILVGVMLKAGFVNYPTEWWHWSYGDRYWAYNSNQPTAVFGPVG